MEWLQLSLSAVLGALCGGVVSYVTATRIARQGEHVRVQEEARQALLNTVRSFRSQVATAPLPTSPRPAMEPYALSSESGELFAEQVEVEAVRLNPSLTERVRAHVVEIVGPITAGSAHVLAHLPPANRRTTLRAELFLSLGSGMTDEQVFNHGLLGKARANDSGQPENDAVVQALRDMESTLNRQI